MGAFSRARQMREAMEARRKVEPRPEGRSSKAVAGKPHRDKVLGYWLVPLPTIDPFIVARSGAALAGVRPQVPLLALRRHQDPAVRRRRHGRGRRRSASRPRSRRCASFLLGKVKQGDGPDESRRAKSWFTVDFVAEGDGRTIHTQVKGGDPGYTETAKMLAESALCLLFDDNPDVAGSVTTAAGDGRQPDGPAGRGGDHVPGRR